MKCSYGCNKEGIYDLGNGKFCCKPHRNSCPSMRSKLSESVKKSIPTRSKRVLGKKKCKYCNKEFSVVSISKHERRCYLNLENLRLCPICWEPIKDKSYTTCSNSCRGIYYSDHFKKISNDYHSSVGHNNQSDYRFLCFEKSEHKCIVCGEDKVLDVHHIDGDHNNNNDVSNLLPLCPTHHRYAHNDELKVFIDQYLVCPVV